MELVYVRPPQCLISDYRSWPNSCSSYIPRDSIQGWSNRKTLLSWYHDLPECFGLNSTLDTALLALSMAFLGNKHGDRRLNEKSEELHKSVLERIHQLKESDTSSITEHLIHTSIANAKYEVRVAYLEDYVANINYC
jgi:hypothetical protein